MDRFVLVVLKIMTFSVKIQSMNKNLIYIAAAAYFVWLFSKKKVSGMTAPSARKAARKARQLVASAVDQTTFIPDETTFADQYAKDKSLCR